MSPQTDRRQVAGRVAAAVLAGGRSRRMGSDKATIVIDGRRMVDRVLDATRAAGCDPVCVVGGDPAAFGLTSGPVSFVADRHPGEGPLGALLTAFEALADVEAILMVPCDVPFVSERVLRPLLERWARERPHGRVDVVVARTDRLEPMCAVWSRRALPRLDEAFADGERALRAVLTAVERAEVPVAAESLRNVNTPQELAEVRRRIDPGG